MRVFLCRYTGHDYTEAALFTQKQRYVTRRTWCRWDSAVYGDTSHLVPALLGQLDGLGERVERVHRVCVSVPADGHLAVSAGSGISYAAMRPRQQKPCHDPIEPRTTTGWLV